MYDYPKRGIEFFTDDAYFMGIEVKTQDLGNIRHVSRYFCFRIGNDHAFQLFRDRFLDNVALDMLEQAKLNKLRLVLRGCIIPHRIDGLFKCDLMYFGLYSGEGEPDFYELRGELWYEHYLSSDQWQEKRQAVLARDGRCVKCGTTLSLVAHHLTYQRVGNEELDDLMTLCIGCHR